MASVPEQVVKVECLEQFDPPYVRVTVGNLIPFDVSWGVYEYMQQNFGFPPLVCGAYSVGQ